jgi:uncharacterized protein (TIGR03435 family)
MRNASARIAFTGFLFAASSLGVVGRQGRASFEVASVKPAEPVRTITLSANGLSVVPLRITGSRVAIRWMSMAEMILRAFEFHRDQLVGPYWLYTERFDIQATLPPRSTAAQVPEMLRSLLEERFGLVTHIEERTLPRYVLAVGKDGAKLGPPVQDPSMSNETGPDGTPIHPDVAKARALPKPVADGRGFVRLEGIQSMQELAFVFIERALGETVIDRTGLPGFYKISVRILESDRLSASGSADPTGSSWFKAVEQLGLTLEHRREPTPVVVVDKAARQPTPN